MTPEAILGALVDLLVAAGVTLLAIERARVWRQTKREVSDQAHENHEHDRLERMEEGLRSVREIQIAKRLSTIESHIGDIFRALEQIKVSCAERMGAVSVQLAEGRADHVGMKERVTDLAQAVKDRAR